MPRAIPADLLTHLQGEATSLVEIVTITPRVGSALRFTDFNESLSVDGNTYLARPGMRVTNVSSNISLEIDNSQAEGFFKSGVVTLADLRNGRFRGARFTRAFVNFDDVSDGSYVFQSGLLGAVSVADNAFRADFRGLSQLLSQPIGRVLPRLCNATLFDGRCKLDPDDYSSSHSIAGVTNAITFTFTGTSNPSAYYDFGKLEWTSGPNDGYWAEIASSSFSGGTTTITLLEQPGSDIAAGHSFTIYAGCDHEFATCLSKFDNTINYRGFPFLVGDRAYEPADARVGYITPGVTPPGGEPPPEEIP